MTVFIGEIIGNSFPSAGEISCDSWYSAQTEDISLNATLKCPHCLKPQMPLRHKNLKGQGVSFPWVGVSHQDTVDHYLTNCSKCKKPYNFRVYYEA